MARISSVTFEALKSNGVDAVKLCATMNTAMSKKTELDCVTTQAKKEFKLTTKDQITRLQLTEEEDHSMIVAAYDSYMVKGAKKWNGGDVGNTTWSLTPEIINFARQYWPTADIIKGAGEKKELVKA